MPVGGDILQLCSNKGGASVGISKILLVLVSPTPYKSPPEFLFRGSRTRAKCCIIEEHRQGKEGKIPAA